MRYMLVFLLSFALCGCASNSNESNNASTANNKCSVPQNPYTNDSGNSAGFEWAKKTGGECAGNSDAFNEGCSEYYAQMSQYTSCAN